LFVGYLNEALGTAEVMYQRMREKEAAVAYIKMSSLYSYGKSEEYHVNPLSE
jgi:hypothetical protein